MNDSAFLSYAVGIIIITVVSYFLFRWIFSVEKRLKQNTTIINLLILIARKHGATNDEIHNSIQL